MPYNKLLTNLACLNRTGEYWPSVVFVRTSLHSVRTATTSGQYSPVRPSRSVSKRLLFTSIYCQVLHKLLKFRIKLNHSIFFKKTSLPLPWRVLLFFFPPSPHPTWEFHFTVASYFPKKTLAFLPLDLIPHGLTWLSSGA